MMKYERLTGKSECGYNSLNACLNCDLEMDCGLCPYWAKALDRLSELEDDLESGKIVKLPCKVGQKVYVDRDTWKNQYIVHFTFIDYKPFYYGEIVSFVKTKKQFLIKVRVYKSSSHLSYETARYPISAIGKTVFLTREEAEARLKEIQK